jgi:fermentation-respiration switch protein FrsA (DUF1100 family)
MPILLAVLAVAALFVLWVRWMEPRMLYYPMRALETTPARLGWRFEDVRLTAADGTRLHGWLVPANGDSGALHPRLTVLLLHGNAGNISHRLDKLAILRDLGVDVLILDYRGYGESEGRPDEAGTYLDARAGYEHLVRTRGLDPRAIVLFGESLGSAVAAHLAAEAEVGGVVLEESFTSLAEVAQGMFPFLPVRWVIRNRYDTLDRIGRVRAPVLILHSRDDEYFPFRHAERLAGAAREPTVVELRGGHNDAFLVSEPVYRQGLAAFFATVAGRARRPSGAAP